MLAAGVVGVLVGRAGLRPMRQLTEAVEHVTETQDLQPVSVPYARGDLAFLAASFNLMLVSLTKTRDRTSRLVADAGHGCGHGASIVATANGSYDGST